MEEISPNNILKVSHISASYQEGKQRKTVLHDISFELHENEILGLVGESGCGKSTLSKVILGFIRPDEGEIISQVDHPQMIFQDPYASLDPRMTVWETIEEVMRALSVGRDEAQRRKRIEELLDWVELPRDAARKLPHEFSGGQRQRIAIARALAVSPKVLICDEPTSALDVSVQAQTVNLLKRLQAATKTAYLFITHNFAVVEYFADRVAVMKAGSILETGATETVLSHPENDYTRTLLNAVPRL